MGTQAQWGGRGGEGWEGEGSSRFSVLSHGSRFTIRSSRFKVHDSQFTVRSGGEGREGEGGRGGEGRGGEKSGDTVVSLWFQWSQ